MTFEINDEKLTEQLRKIFQVCYTEMGKENYAFFGQFHFNDEGMLLAEVGLFTHGSPPKDSPTKQYDELASLQYIISNRKALKYEEQTLKPLIDG